MEDLQSQVEELRRAHDTNAAIFRDTLTALDSAVQAMSLVMDDYISGVAPRTVEVEGARHIDYNHYLSLYTKLLEEKLYEPVAPESPIALPAEDEVRIFGGA